MAKAAVDQRASQPSAAKRPATGKPFVKGGDPRQSQNVGKAAGGPLPEEPDGLTEVQRVRRVWEQLPEADCNTLQRNLRAMIEEKGRAWYWTMMLGLEGKPVSSGEGSGGGGGAGESLPPDEGEARVRRLKGELLERADAGYRAWKESRRGVGPPPS